jgi:hypothetical protein
LAISAKIRRLANSQLPRVTYLENKNEKIYQKLLLSDSTPFNILSGFMRSISTIFLKKYGKKQGLFCQNNSLEFAIF